MIDRRPEFCFPFSTKIAFRFLQEDPVVLTQYQLGTKCGGYKTYYATPGKFSGFSFTTLLIIFQGGLQL